MTALYITSSENGSGKTALCAGLGKILTDSGKKVGYFKPIVSDGSKTSGNGDADFMKEAFGLEATVAEISPVISSRGSLTSSIKETCAKESQGKDVVIIEGVADQNWADGEISEALDAKVILVEDYGHGLKKAVENAGNLGKALLGIVVNKVPKNRLEQARADASSSGLNILGLIPEDRTLLAISVGELAASLSGDIVNGQDRTGDLVENLMLGALALDHGPLYFGRKDNKAVVLKKERPDMQMAAMQTSTACLVLTGEGKLNANVLGLAEDKNIPIITTGSDSTAVAEGLEDTMAGVRFHQASKLARMTELLEQNLDVPALVNSIG